MDKNRKMDEIKELVEKKQYSLALTMLESMDVHTELTSKDLSLFVEVYICNKQFKKAKTLLEVMFKSNATKKVISQLIFVCMIMGELADAEKYYKVYMQVAPTDANVLVFRYRIDKAKGESPRVLISTLEKLDERSYNDEFAYDLANLYNTVKEYEKCMKKCNDIIVLSSNETYIKLANVLKSKAMKAIDMQQKQSVALNDIVKPVAPAGSVVPPVVPVTSTPTSNTLTSGVLESQAETVPKTNDIEAIEAKARLNIELTAKKALESKFRSIEEKKNELEHKLKMEQSARLDLEQKINNYEVIKKSLEDKISIQEKDKAYLEETLQKIQSDYKIAEQKYNDIYEQKMNIENRFNSLDEISKNQSEKLIREVANSRKVEEKLLEREQKVSQLIERLQLEEKTKSQLINNLESKERYCENIEARLQNCEKVKSELEVRYSENNNKIKELETKLTSILQNEDMLNMQVENLMAEKSELEVANHQLDQSCKMLQNNLNEHVKNKQMLENRCRQIMEHKRHMELQYREIESKKKELEKKVSDQEQNAIILGDTIRETKDDFELYKRNAENEIEKIKETYEAEKEALEKDLNAKKEIELKDMFTRKEYELQEMFKKKECELNEVKSRANELISQKDKELEEIKTQAKEIENELKIENDELKRRYERETTEIRSQLEGKLSGTKEALESRLNENNSRHQNEMKNTRLKHEQELADMKAHYEKEIENVKLGYENKINNSHSEYEKELEDTMSTYEQEIEETKVSYEKKLEETIADYEKLLEDTKLDYEKELEDTKAGYEKELEDTKISYEKELDDTKSSYEKELEDTKAGYEKELDGTKASYEKELGDAQRAIEDNRLSYEKELEDTKGNLERELEETRSNLEKQLEDTKLKYERQLTESKSDYEREISNSNNQHLKDYEKLKQDFNAQKEKLERSIDDNKMLDNTLKEKIDIINSLDARIKDVMTERKRLADKTRELEHRLSVEIGNNKKLDDMVTQHIEGKANLESKMAKDKEFLMKLDSQNKDNVATIKKLEADNKQLEERLKNETEQRVSLETRVHDTGIKYVEAIKEVNALKKQLKEQRDKELSLVEKSGEELLSASLLEDNSSGGIELDDIGVQGNDTPSGGAYDTLNTSVSQFLDEIVDDIDDIEQDDVEMQQAQMYEPDNMSSNGFDDVLPDIDMKDIEAELNLAPHGANLEEVEDMNQPAPRLNQGEEVEENIGSFFDNSGIPEFKKAPYEKEPSVVSQLFGSSGPGSEFDANEAEKKQFYQDIMHSQMYEPFENNGFGENINGDYKTEVLNTSIFDYYFYSPTVMDMIQRAIFGINTNRKNNHMVISGPDYYNTSDLSKMIAKQLAEKNIVSTNKIARITGEAFNKVDLDAKAPKLLDGTVIIQNAETINSASFDRLTRLITNYEGRIAVILETSMAPGMIFANNQNAAMFFRGTIELPKYSVNFLLEYVRTMLSMEEMGISTEAENDLANMFNQKIKNNKQFGLEDLCNYVEDCMESAYKRKKGKGKHPTDIIIRQDINTNW